MGGFGSGDNMLRPQIVSAQAVGIQTVDALFVRAAAKNPPETINYFHMFFMKNWLRMEAKITY